MNNMEKLSFNKKSENNGDNQKKSSGLHMWSKAAILGASLVSTNPGFSQENNKIQDDKDKYNVELLQDISSFYEKKAQDKEKNFYYWGNDLSKEDSLYIKKDAEDDISKYKEIAKNPKEFYEKQIKIVEDVRGEILSHFFQKNFLIN